MSLEEDVVHFPLVETVVQLGETQDHTGRQSRPLATTKCFTPTPLQGGGTKEETEAQQGRVPRQ